MATTLSFVFAGLSLSVESIPPEGPVAAPPAYQPFLSQDRKGFCLRLTAGSGKACHGKRIFDCPPIWFLDRSRKTSQFGIYHDYPDLKRTLSIPDEGESALLSFGGSNRDPFLGPAIELLTITRLARGDGAILHGCGISREGRGIVFAGESGAGKSTFSRLWAQEKRVEILSDDRVIVRRQNGLFYLYGTPWHGDAALAAPGGVPLERIFFIRHGEQNAVRPMARAFCVRVLLKCCFPPLWDAAGMRFMLEFFDELTSVVPCAELAFVPDAGVLDFLAP
jgi:hypothetical protein